jgi:hypothetical protein
VPHLGAKSGREEEGEMRNIKYRNDDVFHSRTMNKMMLVSRLSRLRIPQKSHPWTASRNLTHASMIPITQIHTMRARARERERERGLTRTPKQIA